MHVELGLGDIGLIVEAIEHYTAEEPNMAPSEREDYADLLEYLQHRRTDRRDGLEGCDIKNAVATAIFQREDGKLLTEWRNDGIFAPGALAFPGGRMKYGETPKEALQREVEEELGVTPVFPCTSLGRVLNKGYTLHLFLIREWEGKLPGHTLDAGHGLGWVTPEKAFESMWRPTSIGALRVLAHCKSEKNSKSPLLQAY